MDPRNKVRANSTAGITAALLAWDKAPAHVKVMAGAYVGPLLDSMTAMNRELHVLSREIEQLQGAEHGNA